MLKLEHEIKQTKPFENLCQETALSIRYTADTVNNAYASVMAVFGVTPQQYNVLRIVRGAGKEGIPTTLIGERMIEKNPGLTRLIDRLERKKLLSRKRSKSDRRVVICHSTKAGLELLEQMQDSISEAEVTMMAELKEDNLNTLINLLAEVRRGIEE